MKVFVARQPIFDKRQKVVAYELLYRSGEINNFDGTDGDSATASVIINSLFRIGLDSLTGGKKAFINFTANLLKEEIPLILNKDLLVIEILENIMPDQELIEACQFLKEKGYKLALDDFILDFMDTHEELLNLVDIIKVDFLANSTKQRNMIPQKLKNKKIEFLAEKVETKDDYEEAVKAGYKYFQGYFFTKPEIVTGKDIPASKLTYFQTLKELNEPEPDINYLAQLIETNVTLTYELLRLINSATFSGIKRITSVKHALIRLGTEELRKWVSLMLISDLGKGKADEITTSSLIRAKLGELLAEKAGYSERKAEVFLMGMFSLIDVLLQRPLDEILAQLPLALDLKKAMLTGEGRLGLLFQLILNYERGNWGKIEYLTQNLKIEEESIPELYFKAIDWVQAVLNLTKTS